MGEWTKNVEVVSYSKGYPVNGKVYGKREYIAVIVPEDCIESAPEGQKGVFKNG